MYIQTASTKNFRQLLLFLVFFPRIWSWLIIQYDVINTRFGLEMPLRRRLGLNACNHTTWVKTYIAYCRNCGTPLAYERAIQSTSPFAYQWRGTYSTTKQKPKSISCLVYILLKLSEWAISSFCSQNQLKHNKWPSFKSVNSCCLNGFVANSLLASLVVNYVPRTHQKAWINLYRFTPLAWSSQ